MKVDVYSHSFQVKELSGRQKEVLDMFSRGLIQYEIVMEAGRKYRKPARVFASAYADRQCYRYHINLLEEFKRHLQYNQIYGSEVEWTYHEVELTDEYRTEYVVKSMPPPRGPQPVIIDHILADGSNKIITLQTGQGKASVLSAMIKIPGGWTTMGKIKLGDVVCTPDGGTAVVDGIFPQGKVPVYKVTFWDGRYTVVCGEHLWQSFYVNTSEHRRWAVRDTLEMKRLISMPNPRVYVPLIKAEDGPAVELPIPPYTLGAILGDGNITGKSIYVSKFDLELFDRIESELLPGCVVEKLPSSELAWVIKGIERGNNPYVKALEKMGLMGSPAWEKFVPVEYLLTPNRQQRLDLLQGLMDTDGTSDSREVGGAVSFNSTSLRLAQDVQYLVRSLGGIASISKRKTRYTYKGVKLPGRPSWNVNIRYPKPSELFSISRKKERVKDDGQYNDILKLRVKSIEYYGEEEAQCISIDHPEHLYITDDFIVTHNTYLTKASIAKLGLRSVFFMKGSYIDRWIPDMDETFEFGKHELLSVRGSAALNAIMEMALEKDFTAKATFISINTFSEYIKTFEREGVSSLYPIEPGRFFEVMRFGVGVFDEGHQFPHQVMKLFTYTHVNKFITLSATLDTKDPFMDRMYKIMYPANERFNAGFYDAFIAVYAIMYQLRRPRTIRHTGWGGAYSHTTFEQSIMSGKNKVELKNYLDMINHYVTERFVNVMQKGQKMIIFCATVKFCTLLTKYLQKLHPRMKVVRYVAADKMSVMESADIIVSTVLSAGTAVDIPNLRVGLMTNALDSQQSNEQVLGRTRRLKDFPDVTPEFLYFVCTTIDKHVNYHKNKLSFFRNKVKSHGTLQSPISV